MAVIPIREQKIYKANFRRFGGADFTSVPTQVALHRSPDMCNMIANEKFFPVKRPGYQVKIECSHDKERPIYGLHPYSAPNGKQYLMVHAGDRLYAYQPGTLYDYDEYLLELAQAPSRSFVMGGTLYLMDGAHYYYVGMEDGFFRSGLVSSRAFIPTTSIARTPFGAGTAFEAVNLLTRKRKNSFAADGTSRDFQLDRYPADSVDAVSVNGVLYTAHMDESIGHVIYVAEDAPESADLITFTCDLQNGVVRFAVPPESAGGVDNVVITFTAGEDHSSDIDKCRISGMFGGNNDTRVFLSGNPDKPNTDWQSGLYDPTYFPDTGYTKIGSDNSAIMGYARQYDTQIVIKEGGKQDATQWLRTFSLDSENRPKYAIAQGAVGYGAISMDAFGVLGDTPLFLSSAGVCAVVGTAVSQQRSIQNRSMLMNKRLKAEADSSCCAYVFGNRYYLSCAEHVYVADGAQTYSDDDIVTQYEWYYWDGFEPTAMTEYDGRLYFGTQTGKVCAMGNVDETEYLTDGGEAFPCWWTTPLQSFGSLNNTKTINDVAYMLMPYSQAQYQVFYKSDKRDWEEMKSASLSMFDFDNMNFDDLSFLCDTTPITERTGRKERKCEVFQVKIYNDAIGTQMGLLGIEITYKLARKVR